LPHPVKRIQGSYGLFGVAEAPAGDSILLAALDNAGGAESEDQNAEDHDHPIPFLKQTFDTEQKQKNPPGQADPLIAATHHQILGPFLRVGMTSRTIAPGIITYFCVGKQKESRPFTMTAPFHPAPQGCIAGPRGPQ
jgi:hypothetical protein